MSASQRRKGQAGEREAYKVLWEALGDIVERRDLSQVRDGGGDIRIPKARVVVEVKRTNRRSVPTWLRQAEASALLLSETGKPQWVAAVMWRRNGEAWSVYCAYELGEPVRGVARGYHQMTLPEFCDWVRGRL